MTKKTCPNRAIAPILSHYRQDEAEQSTAL
jgi:hypothetical protein